ncbi:hypothetical protein JCM6882_006223 [Rhodosporidiobolus microsporus]
MPHATSSDDYSFSLKWMERDTVGYGRTPPNPNWPNNAKIAVNFVLNFEEGGERTVEDGFEYAEDNLHEFKNHASVKGKRDPTVESQFDYGSRVAIWRILDLFESNGIKITFYAVARAFERNPHIARAAEEFGHEIASHCHTWQPHANMTPQQEEEWIVKAVESFAKTSPTGKVPVGWFYGRPSEDSCALVNKVYREKGHELLYWADNFADDLPFWTVRPGEEDKGLLIMPYSLDNNDFKYYWGQLGSDKAFEERILDSFMTIRDEALAGKRHGYITCALHTRWIGRPGRFQTLKRIVEGMLKHDDVWFATREEIARHFSKEFTFEQGMELRKKNAELVRLE